MKAEVKTTSEFYEPWCKSFDKKYIKNKTLKKLTFTIGLVNFNDRDHFSKFIKLR